MTHWRVTYAVDFDDGDAETPLEAARLAADQLAEPGVPERGSYTVVDMDNAIEHHVDLDLPQNGGTGYFS